MQGPAQGPDHNKWSVNSVHAPRLGFIFSENSPRPIPGWIYTHHPSTLPHTQGQEGARPGWALEALGPE